jgi:hypothetical protein
MQPSKGPSSRFSKRKQKLNKMAQELAAHLDVRSSATFAQEEDGSGNVLASVALPIPPRMATRPQHALQKERNISCCEESRTPVAGSTDNNAAAGNPSDTGTAPKKQGSQVCWIVSKSQPKITTDFWNMQTSNLIGEFKEASTQLLDLIIRAEVCTQNINTKCPCQRRNCLVTCFDCTGHRSTCKECFAEAHMLGPLHWADVWDPEECIFKQCEVSSLLPGGALHLGHMGKPCPSNEASDFPILMILVDTNGIHNVKVQFCWCSGYVDHVQQLFQACLFPSTLRQPRMAFTFNVLNQFSVHHLESKSAAQDYVKSLIRLTDNEFSSTISVREHLHSSLLYQLTNDQCRIRMTS